jgi:hypothetical protein
MCRLQFGAAAMGSARSPGRSFSLFPDRFDQHSLGPSSIEFALEESLLA